MDIVPLLLCCFLAKNGATEDEGYIKTIEAFDIIQKETEDDRTRNDSAILIKTTHLYDSHKQLLVYWVGEDSDVIVCVARNPTPATGLHPSRPSAVYISYDNGETFVNKTDHFQTRGNYATLKTFYKHPNTNTHFVFVDVEHNVLYTTMDQGHKIQWIKLRTFTPSHVSFHEFRPSVFVVWDKKDPMQKLWVTEDFGYNFRLVQDNVKAFSWVKINETRLALVVQKEELDGHSAVLYSTDLFSKETVMVQDDVENLYVKGDYLFITKLSASRSLDLYVSYKLGKTIKCVLDTELETKGYFIVDVTGNKALVAVSHSDVTSHLYVSENLDTDVVGFTLSLKDVFCYFPNSTWHQTWIPRATENPFADIYKVEGLTGIYIASRVLTKPRGNNLGPEHLGSVITFDHGRSWRLIKAPKHEIDGQPSSCTTEDGCSLHLSQKLSQLHPHTRSKSILSSKSAPGVIVATGVQGRSLEGRPGIYISNDGGLTWRQILKDLHFYDMGDHGGVLTAVKYFDLTSGGRTNHMLYSTDLGDNWQQAELFDQDMKFYDMMTKPGEKTTEFLLFGSLPRQHKWTIVKVDLRNTFQSNCTQSDYESWSPSPSNGTVTGQQITLKRRIPQTNCYNGLYFDARTPLGSCKCNIVNQSNITEDKTCVGNSTCPSNENHFMIFAERQKIHRLSLKTHIVETLVTNISNVVAIEFDTKNNCLYWSDITAQTICRVCLDSGKSEVLMSSGLDSVEGLALDWISNNLYFVNSGERAIELIRIDVDHSTRMRRRILGADVLTKPRGIAVHPEAGYMFWTDWSRENASISRADLDGSNVKKLIGEPVVKWPNAVTVDYAAGRIYWSDAREDCIASCDFDGADHKKVVYHSDAVGHPFGVAVFENKVYWDDWKRRSIFVADKNEFRELEVVHNLTTIPLDLKIYTRGGRVGSNSCSNTTCPYICVGGPIRSSCLCPDGMNCVTVTNSTPKMNSTAKKTCPSGRFTCDNGSCLPNTWRCDGENDCRDNSDEANCGVACPSNSFRCRNGTCVPSSFRCDDEEDCPDGSDEKDCPTKTCKSNEFACNHGQCIALRWRCDGSNDCRDGSDERNCTKEDGATCRSNEFKCQSGPVTCIPGVWRCDGEKDCSSGSDEVNCPRKSCLGEQFACGDKRDHCIYRSWVCDGDKDCVNGRDEMNCTTTTPKPESTVLEDKPCKPWMLKCVNQKCIPSWWKCDGADDCGDGSDEVGCSGTTSTAITTPLPPSITTSEFDASVTLSGAGDDETKIKVTPPTIDPLKNKLDKGNENKSEEVTFGNDANVTLSEAGDNETESSVIFPTIASLEGKLIKENGTSVELTWTVLEAGNTTWIYGVYYGVNREDLYREPRLNTTSLTATIINLEDSKTYIFKIGIVGPDDIGPLSKIQEIIKT